MILSVLVEGAYFFLFSSTSRTIPKAWTTEVSDLRRKNLDLLFAVETQATFLCKHHGSCEHCAQNADDGCNEHKRR